MLNGVIVLLRITLGRNARGSSHLRYYWCNHVCWLLLTGNIFTYSVQALQIPGLKAIYFFSFWKTLYLDSKIFRVCGIDKLLFWCIKSHHVTILFQYLLLYWQLTVVTVVLVALCYFKKSFVVRGNQIDRWSFICRSQICELSQQRGSDALKHAKWNLRWSWLFIGAGI